METRMKKWRWKRIQMESERQILATTLLDTSEKLMVVHSYVNSRTFDDMMGDPINCIEGWFNVND